MRLGVIVARFQVPELSEGHKKLIEFVKNAHGQVLVCLGCTEVLGSKRNPLDYPTRVKMLLEYDQDILVAPIQDQPSNDLWSQNLDRIIHTYCPIGDVALYGGRDSFIPFYGGKHKTFEIETEGSASGTDIRQITANKLRVSSDFRAGIIYATHHQYKRVFPTVDIAVIRDGQVLLGQKINDTQWRFPGGFVDQEDDCLELAAVRECMEETGITSEGPLEYVCSHRGKDWRYKHPDDGVIMTTLYALKHFIGSPHASDDLNSVRWFPIARETMSMLVETHKPLFEKLVEKYGHLTMKGEMSV